jgi:hypothetical protein
LAATLVSTLWIASIQTRQGFIHHSGIHAAGGYAIIDETAVRRMGKAHRRDHRQARAAVWGEDGALDNRSCIS